MSGRKNNLSQVEVLTAANGATNQTSSVVDIQFLDNIGIQCNLSGGSSLTGTFNVQVSADHSQDAQGNVIVVGNWITATTASVASGSPAQTYFDMNQLSAPWLKVTWTASSGTGTINMFVTGKML
jgi:hypothetical protein